MTESSQHELNLHVPPRYALRAAAALEAAGLRLVTVPLADGDPLMTLMVGPFTHIVSEIPGRTDETGGVNFRITLRLDGTVEVWNSVGRHATEIADILRMLADGFENKPRRIR